MPTRQIDTAEIGRALISAGYTIAEATALMALIGYAKRSGIHRAENFVATYGTKSADVIEQMDCHF